MHQPDELQNFASKSFTFELPLSKVDLSKQYTVAVETSINGAPAKPVRSAFGSVEWSE